MAHFSFIGEGKQVGVDFFTGQGGHGQGCDKLLRRFCQNSSHSDILFLQQTDQFQRLVGCNAATDDEKNGFCHDQTNFAAMTTRAMAPAESATA